MGTEAEEDAAIEALMVLNGWVRSQGE